MNQSSAVAEKPSQGPYTSPPPIGYPTRDAVVGDPRVSSVETKSKGDGFWKGCIIIAKKQKGLQVKLSWSCLLAAQLPYAAVVSWTHASETSELKILCRLLL
ncbi:hypothetical protein YC2023_061092 [Brassica napus]